MERTITVFMMNILKNSVFYIIILLILLYKGVFINLIANINLLLTKPNDNQITEINILKEKNQELENNLSELSQLPVNNNEYKLTKLSYRLSYSDYNFYIEGNDYQTNNLLINQDGLVGIIKELKNDYSECILLPGISNLSIKINDTYGTITSYENGLFIINDISNYDNVSINDLVYTSTIGGITSSTLVGTVNSIEEHDINKTIYVKSNVDFNNINYLYVVS